MSAAIQLTDVGKRYVVANSRPPDTLAHRLASATRNLTQRIAGQKPEAVRDLWAVRGVNLQVRAGEAVGIIGHNGAGKSTLLKMLSRVTEPTEGRIEINGRVASLLEVGTGFHPDLSCRQNVYLYGAILGMSLREISSRFDSIVAFAEVSHLLDEPVKHLSSGMYMRLAFSVAVFLETEILVVDEVLAVGDSDFQRKCVEHIQQATRRGRTVLFVSHDLALVSQLAERTVVVEGGRIAFDGPTAAGLQRYMSDRQRSAFAHRKRIDELFYRAKYRAGGAVLIREIGLSSNQRPEIAPGQDVALELLIESSSSQEKLRILYSINNSFGQPVLTGFTSPFPVEPGENLLELRIPTIKVAPGDYDFTVSIGTGGLEEGKIEYDAYRGIGQLTVSVDPTGARSFGYWRADWGSVYHEGAEVRPLGRRPA